MNNTTNNSELQWNIRNYIRKESTIGKHFRDIEFQFNLTLKEIMELVPDAVLMPSGFLSLAIPRDRIDYLS